MITGAASVLTSVELCTLTVALIYNSLSFHFMYKSTNVSVTYLVLVADFDKKVATSYGVLLSNGMPTRALFIIDPAG